MNKDTIKSQLSLLVQIARSIQIKYVLAELDPDPKLNFWRLIHGSFLDLPVLDWCKIFGSNAEPTHWKDVVSDISKFRNEMFSHLNITKDEWNEYWFQMKNYRDELVAHYEPNYNSETYPDLELAFKSSCFYHDYLVNLIDNETEEKMEILEEYSKRFYIQTKKIAQIAIKATDSISEVTY